MPELPEVETIRRQLAPRVSGRVLTSVEVLDDYFTKPVAPELFRREVEGRTLVGVERRGKYLIFRFHDRDAMVVHLRMTGSIIYVRPDGTADPGDARVYRSGDERHLKARFALDDGSEIRFFDPRRFGRGSVASPEELELFFSERLGLEPLSKEFTAEALGGIVEGRTGPLKSFLLNQKGVAGIGNIYADEALHRAGLHPLSPGGSMKPAHHEALRNGIVASLERGLELGGASIDDYRDAEGDTGSMQDEFLVHLREGEECLRCGTVINRIVVGGRSTYYCPGCQERLRRRPRRRKKAKASRSSGAKGTIER